MSSFLTTAKFDVDFKAFTMNVRPTPSRQSAMKLNQFVALSLELFCPYSTWDPRSTRQKPFADSLVWPM